MQNLEDIIEDQTPGKLEPQVVLIDEITDREELILMNIVDKRS